MDGTTALVIIIVIFAVVALVAIWRYRSRIDLSLHTGETGLTVKGENEAASGKAAAPSQSSSPASVPDKPGVNIQDAKSGGGILAEDKTGKGVNIERVETQDDILASSETPPAPKA